MIKSVPLTSDVVEDDQNILVVSYPQWQHYGYIARITKPRSLVLSRGTLLSLLLAILRVPGCIQENRVAR